MIRIKNINSIICLIFLTIGCKKETNTQYSIEGKWSTIYEVSKKISTKTPGKVIFELVHLKNEFKTTGLEISKNNMIFIYKDDDYAKVNYQLLTGGSNKYNFIYILNNNHKLQYKLDKDTLRLIELVNGSYKPDEEPHYNLTETKLMRQK